MGEAVTSTDGGRSLGLLSIVGSGRESLVDRGCQYQASRYEQGPKKDQLGLTGQDMKRVCSVYKPGVI
jgi:hypothetical protein